jgi:hypothetical protein
MTGKRKTASKAARPDRVGARSHAQKRGTIKKPVEHDQRRKAAPAEQNGSTLPPNIHDQEKVERARHGLASLAEFSLALSNHWVLHWSRGRRRSRQYDDARPDAHSAVEVLDIRIGQADAARGHERADG